MIPAHAQTIILINTFDFIICFCSLYQYIITQFYCILSLILLFFLSYTTICVADDLRVSTRGMLAVLTLKLDIVTLILHLKSEKLSSHLRAYQLLVGQRMQTLSFHFRFPPPLSFHYLFRFSWISILSLYKPRVVYGIMQEKHIFFLNIVHI